MESTPTRGARVGLRVGILFLVLTALFQAILYQWVFDSAGFRLSMEWTARVAALSIELWGVDAVARGTVVASGVGSVELKNGCDALQPISVLVAAVLAWPARFGWRLVGILAGASLLLAANLARVVSLFFANAYAQSVFEALHTQVWPLALVILALCLWWVWATIGARRGYELAS